jgi:hypothetical protein
MRGGGIDHSLIGNSKSMGKKVNKTMGHESSFDNIVNMNKFRESE